MGADVVGNDVADHEYSTKSNDDFCDEFGYFNFGHDNSFHRGLIIGHVLLARWAHVSPWGGECSAVVYKSASGIGRDPKKGPLPTPTFANMEVTLLSSQQFLSSWPQPIPHESYLEDALDP